MDGSARLAGAEAMTWAEAARRWAAARAPGRRVVPFPMFGGLAAGFRAGHNTAPHRPQGRETFARYLARTP